MKPQWGDNISAHYRYIESSFGPTCGVDGIMIARKNWNTVQKRLSTAARTFLKPHSFSNGHILSNISHNKGVKLSQILSRIMWAISLFNKKGSFKSDGIGMYKFCLRPWQNLECTGMQYVYKNCCDICNASLHTYIYIYIYQHVVDKLLDIVLGVSQFPLWGTTHWLPVSIFNLRPLVESACSVCHVHSSYAILHTDNAYSVCYERGCWYF